MNDLLSIDEMVSDFFIRAKKRRLRLVGELCTCKGETHEIDDLLYCKKCNWSEEDIFKIGSEA